MNAQSPVPFASYWMILASNDVWCARAVWAVYGTV